MPLYYSDPIRILHFSVLGWGHGFKTNFSESLEFGFNRFWSSFMKDTAPFSALGFK